MASQTRPQALHVIKTIIYKSVEGVDLPCDVHEPSVVPKDPKVVVYIHGGAWMVGNRSDYCRPLIDKLRALGYVIMIPEYRLLPESSFKDQLDDVQRIPAMIYERYPACSDIFVIGASAGALLAMHAITLWDCDISALVTLYAPTDLHRLLPDRRNKSVEKQIDDFLLASADKLPICQYPLDARDDRSRIASLIVRNRYMMPLLLGTIEVKENRRYLQLGEICNKNLNAISPCHFLPSANKCPPILQVTAEADEIFDESHAKRLQELLNNAEIQNDRHSFSEVEHAWDVWMRESDKHCETFCKLIVDWFDKFSKPIRLAESGVS